MIKIIPAIDIMDGKCVRLSQGDFNLKKTYNEDPIEVAKSFEAAGIKYLHMVDLDGAKLGKVINLNVLENISKATKLKIDFGGGIKTEEEVEAAFNAGASQVNIGSIAVKSPELLDAWIKKYGADKFILSADVRDSKVAISGWVEKTELYLLDFIGNWKAKGINRVTCTDISKDGLLEGPSFSLYEELRKLFPGLEIIASGGISQLSDISQLNNIGVEGVIIGKAIYEGNIQLKDLQKWLA